MQAKETKEIIIYIRV